MANDIEKFDPSKLMDGVKDRIKATFVSLIPDDMWNAMVEKEIYIFTTGKIIPHHDCDYSKKDENGNYVYNDWEERIPYNDRDEYDSWGHVKNPAEISPLRRMIRDFLQEKIQQNLKEFEKDLPKWHKSTATATALKDGFRLYDSCHYLTIEELRKLPKE